MTKSFVFASYPMPRAASEARSKGLMVSEFWHLFFSQTLKALFQVCFINKLETFALLLKNLQVLPPCKLLYLATFPQSRSQFQSWILVTHITSFFLKTT